MVPFNLITLAREAREVADILESRNCFQGHPHWHLLSWFQRYRILEMDEKPVKAFVISDVAWRRQLEQSRRSKKKCVASRFEKGGSEEKTSLCNTYRCRLRRRRRYNIVHDSQDSWQRISIRSTSRMASVPSNPVDVSPFQIQQLISDVGKLSITLLTEVTYDN